MVNSRHWSSRGWTGPKRGVSQIREGEVSSIVSRRKGLAQLRHTPTTGSANGYMAISANMHIHLSLNFAGSIGLQPFHRGFC